jgi:hypothetical protein
MTAQHTSVLNGTVIWLGSLSASYAISQCRKSSWTCGDVNRSLLSYVINIYTDRQTGHANYWNWFLTSA